MKNIISSILTDSELRNEDTIQNLASENTFLPWNDEPEPTE